MMNSLREIFDENSETNKRMRKQAEEWKQESIREKSCPSCRYADLIDDGQGYSHYECRLRKKKTDILNEDKNCIYHRTKDDYKILDYDRKAILDVYLEALDLEISKNKSKAKNSRAPEKRLKYELAEQQTEKLKNTLVWLMGK